MSKPWWQSKMLWIGILTILGGIAEFIAGLPPSASVATIIAGILNIILRLLPTLPINGTAAAKKSALQGK